MRIWLASASPRRKQLLQWCGYDSDVHPQEIDESLQAGEDAVAYALRLADEKAASGPRDRIVLAADTVVHLAGEIFGKPTDRADARRILAQLSGQWHTVTTSVCIRHLDHKSLFAAHTAVRLRNLTVGEMAAYVDSGEADDKAGAYGIQGRAGAFIAELKGCWTNVMGLPMESVLHTLEALSRS